MNLNIMKAMYTPLNTNVITDNGDTFIPASQRPDGTWRKARRVKEGYVPQEEVPLYESKGKQFLTRNTKPEPVTLSNGQVAQRPIPGLFIIDDKDKEKKTSKKKAKSKVDDVCLKLQSTSISIKDKDKVIKQKEIKQEVNEKDDKKAEDDFDPTKKIRNLKKRVREIEALEEKLKDGTITKPEPEQLLKIKRKNDLLLQIHQLEKLLE